MRDAIEKERLETLERLNLSADELAGFAPGGLGCHEALHVASIIADMIEERLIEHPSVAMRADWYEMANAALQSVFDLYQAIGKDHLLPRGTTP